VLEELIMVEDSWGIICAVRENTLEGLSSQYDSWFDRQRTFKRLAKLIHPDKCHYPGAKEAFQMLQQALC
jgi:hypothetical protein